MNQSTHSPYTSQVAIEKQRKATEKADFYRKAIDLVFPKPHSYETAAQTKVAIIPWGLKHDIGESGDPMVNRIVSSLEHSGYEIAVVTGNNGQKGMSRQEDPATFIKALGFRKVVMMVAISNEAMLELMGNLCVAGVEITLVGIEGYKLTPIPCTRRHFADPSKKWNPAIYRIFDPERLRRDDSMDKWDSGIPEELATLAGKWIKLANNIHRWQEPKWSYDELANSVMPFGKIIMWTPDDYWHTLANGKKIWFMERPVMADEIIEEIISEANRTEWNNLALLMRKYYSVQERSSHNPKCGIEYRPIGPPDDIEYPHELDLTGFKFNEVPARRIDYLVGQSWIYGEYSQRLRQWHAHPVIQAELAKFEDREYESGLKSDSSGYWDDAAGKDSDTVPYITTGCQGGKPINYSPVWLTPRDRFGKPIPKKQRIKFGEQLKDRYAAGLERMGYIDTEDPSPENMVFGLSWAFEDQTDGTYERVTGRTPRTDSGRSLDSIREETLDDDDSLEGDEGTHYSILDEAEDFIRKPTDEAKWIYNADIHASRAVERAKAKAITRGQKARASADPDAIAAAKDAYRQACKEQGWQRKKAEEKAEAHAWYLASELLQRLERLKERANDRESIDKSRDAEAREKRRREDIGQMFEELDKISLEITPLLRKYLSEHRKDEGKCVRCSRMIAGMSGWKVTKVNKDGSVFAIQKRKDAELTMFQVIREEGRQTRAALEERSAWLRRDWQTKQVANVLREHSELIYEAMRLDYGMLVKTLRENPDIEVPADLVAEARKFHKEQVRRFPELWTKKGTRRVYPVHERAAKKQAQEK